MIDPVHNAALELLGYPYVTSARPGHREVDCCTLAERVLHRVYPAAAWDPKTHADMMISHGNPARPFSPIDAVVRVGVGQAVALPTAGRWHLVQGWKWLVEGRIVKGSRGHTFLWWAETASDGFVLEATPLNRTWWRPLSWSRQASNWDEVRLAALRTP